jgi:hypothetical protein
LIERKIIDGPEQYPASSRLDLRLLPRGGGEADL